MERTRIIFLYSTVICWATLIGGMLYSHIVYFPPYLSHLPESTALINGPFALHDEHFWMIVHPLTILSLVITLILNWNNLPRRKYVVIAIGSYTLAIIGTGIYFVPELMAFAESDHSGVPAAEWLQRGQTWQYLSWMRGAVMYFGFIMMLIAFKKGDDV